MSTLLALADDIAADRRITADEALAMRKEIFPDGVITRAEADVLVSLNGQVDKVDVAWTHAFVEAIGDYALGCGAHPGHVDEATTAWLSANLGADLLSVETLLKLVERAESAPDSLMALVRMQVGAYVAGKAMDRAAVELVRRALFASGGAGGVAVEAPEMEWLFALDAESDGRANDPAWRDFFVKASMAHVAARRAPAALEPGASLLTKPVQAPATVFSMMRDLVGRGGFAGYLAHAKRPDEVAAMEERYAEINAEMENDAVLTAVEVAEMRALAGRDRKLTVNERAFLEALEQLEAEQTRAAND